MTQNPPKKENLTDWQAPVVFKTSDFFGPTSTEKQSTGDDTQESGKEMINSSPVADQTQESSNQTTDR